MTHLDELPQVVNILRGDLSVVGPRPEQPHYVAELAEKLPFYDLRHLVRPGLTGWAQVTYGYAGDESDALEKLQYEFFYLRHQDLRFDLRIIGRTVRSVARQPGPRPVTAPTVSVIIPARDEAERIEGALAAIARHSLPPDDVEVLVVDGGSSDETAERARVALRGLGLAGRVVVNARGDRSSNLNRGLQEARGQVVCRIDARSIVSPEHLARCVALLEDGSRAVVGGPQHAVAAGPGARRRGIARALNNRIATGGAAYRRSQRSGAVDTVYLGAFRTADLYDAGGWDEDLEVNEDFDLNARLSRRGDVWFDPGLAADYVARDEVRSVAHQYWAFGRGKVRYLRARGCRPALRQATGMGAVPVALLTATLVASAARRRAALVPAAMLVTAIGAVVVDGAGAAPGDRAGAATRAWSVGTCLTVIGAWSAGACWEAVAGVRRG